MKKFIAQLFLASILINPFVGIEDKSELFSAISEGGNLNLFTLNLPKLSDSFSLKKSLILSDDIYLKPELFVFLIVPRAFAHSDFSGYLHVLQGKFNEYIRGPPILSYI